MVLSSSGEVPVSACKRKQPLYSWVMKLVLPDSKTLFYSAICLASLGVTTAGLTFAYVAGFGLWLQTRPPSFWMLGIALGLFVGMVIGGAAMLHVERNLVLHIWRASAQSDPQVRTALARILLIMAAQRTVAENQRERRLAHAVLLLTENPIVDGVCQSCGSSHKDLLTGRKYDPACHSMLYHAETRSKIACPIPYSRKIATEVASELGYATRTID